MSLPNLSKNLDAVLFVIPQSLIILRLTVSMMSTLYILQCTHRVEYKMNRMSNDFNVVLLGKALSRLCQGLLQNLGHLGGLAVLLVDPLFPLLVCLHLLQIYRASPCCVYHQHITIDTISTLLYILAHYYTHYYRYQHITIDITECLKISIDCLQLLEFTFVLGRLPLDRPVTGTCQRKMERGWGSQGGK